MNKQSRKQHIERRNKNIKEDFIKLSNERYGKHKKYTNDAIMLKLADKYYLSERTIEDIVFTK